MAKRTKIVKVKGHYRMIPDYRTGRVVVDPDNPSNESYTYRKRKVYVEPYDKIVTYDDGT
jgi:hypothetical protein